MSMTMTTVPTMLSADQIVNYGIGTDLLNEFMKKEKRSLFDIGIIKMINKRNDNTVIGIALVIFSISRLTTLARDFRTVLRLTLLVVMDAKVTLFS